MDRKTKAIVAAVAGASLLIGGGGTWALWSDEAEVEGAQVTSGSMELTIDGPTTWYDFSSDRANAGGAQISVGGLFRDDPAPIAPASTGLQIDPATFRLVPGDVIVGATKFSIEAEGDNIAYALKIAASAGSSADLPGAGEMFGVSTNLLELHTRFALLDETDSPVSLVMADNGQYVVAPAGGAGSGLAIDGETVVVIEDPEAVKGWTLLVGGWLGGGDSVGLSGAVPGLTLSAVQVRPVDLEFKDAYDVFLTYVPTGMPYSLTVIAVRDITGLSAAAAADLVKPCRDSGARVLVTTFDSQELADAAKAQIEAAGSTAEVVSRTVLPS